MRQLLIFVISALLFASVTNAQQAPADQQKKDFIAACLAGAIKTGCPSQNTQTSDVSESAVSIDEIKARNAAAQTQADNDAAKARTALQSPSQALIPVPIAPIASSIPTQPAPVIETASKPPITPKHIFITPLGRHSAAACGPATPPPGAGALYGINRARCLRTAR